MLVITCVPLYFVDAVYADDGSSLFFLSPTYDWYFPADGQARDAFGSTWAGWGFALNNTEAFGWSKFGLGDIALRPYVGYLHADEGNNDAEMVPIGIEARWGMPGNDFFKPYVGLGLSGYGIKFEDLDAGINTGWRGAYGGRFLLGVDISKWFNFQAAYSVVSDVEGYDLSGFSLQGKLKIYF